MPRIISRRRFLKEKEKYKLTVIENVIKRFLNGIYQWKTLGQRQ